MYFFYIFQIILKKITYLKVLVFHFSLKDCIRFGRSSRNSKGLVLIGKLVFSKVNKLSQSMICLQGESLERSK